MSVLCVYVHEAAYSAAHSLTLILLFCLKGKLYVRMCVFVFSFLLLFLNLNYFLLIVAEGDSVSSAFFLVLFSFFLLLHMSPFMHFGKMHDGVLAGKSRVAARAPYLLLKRRLQRETGRRRRKGKERGSATWERKIASIFFSLSLLSFYFWWNSLYSSSFSSLLFFFHSSLSSLKGSEMGRKLWERDALWLVPLRHCFSFTLVRSSLPSFIFLFFFGVGCSCFLLFFPQLYFFPLPRHKWESCTLASLFLFFFFSSLLSCASKAVDEARALFFFSQIPLRGLCCLFVPSSVLPTLFLAFFFCCRCCRCFVFSVVVRIGLNSGSSAFCFFLFTHAAFPFILS